MALDLNQQTFVNIIRQAINNVNADLVLEKIIEELSDSKMGYMIDVLYMNEPVEFIYREDYVKIKMSDLPIHHKNNNYMEDILQDLGLTKDGYCFGKVIKDGGWSGEYDPWHGTLIVNMFYHDLNSELQEIELRINTSKVIKIEKSDIPYFSPKVPNAMDDDLPF